MKIYQKRWSQLVPGDLHQVWDFFSRPENLERITPNDMQFDIITDVSGVEMYAGLLIEYKVSPFPGFRTQWVTEITAVKKEKYFIDEQRFGPFSFWHHQHHFAEVDEGVLMTDILHYGIPFGPIGWLANKISVSNRIERIFEHRKSVIPQYFPKRQVASLADA